MRHCQQYCVRESKGVLCRDLTTSRGPRWRRIATVVLLEYASLWYAFADVAVLTAACVLGAVSTLESLSACRASAIAVLVMFSVQLVLCAIVRPFTTLFSHVYTLFTS